MTKVNSDFCVELALHAVSKSPVFAQKGRVNEEFADLTRLVLDKSQSISTQVGLRALKQVGSCYEKASAKIEKGEEAFVEGTAALYTVLTNDLSKLPESPAAKHLLSAKRNFAEAGRLLDKATGIFNWALKSVR